MPGRALKSVPPINASPTDDPFDPFDPLGNDRRGLACGDWCAPLHLLDAVVRGKPYVGWFDPVDFMLMDQEERAGRTINLYKHRRTRHYLHLDNLGKPYGTPPRPRDSKVFVPYGPIKALAALDAVGLWELPWMKPELESERRGFSWENRAKHPVVKAALKRMTPPQQRSALR